MLYFSCWAMANEYQITVHPLWGLCGGSCDGSWWEMRWDLNDPCGHAELLQQLNNRTEWDRDWGSYLRVEVSVVNVLVVQVDHSSAYITGQVHLLSPAQGNVFPGQKLLQTATIYILKQPTYTECQNKRNNKKRNKQKLGWQEYMDSFKFSSKRSTNAFVCFYFWIY